MNFFVHRRRQSPSSMIGGHDGGSTDPKTGRWATWEKRKKEKNLSEMIFFFKVLVYIVAWYDIILGMSSKASKWHHFGPTHEPDPDPLKICMFWEWGVNFPFDSSAFFACFNLVIFILFYFNLILPLWVYLFCNLISWPTVDPLENDTFTKVGIFSFWSR